MQLCVSAVLFISGSLCGHFFQLAAHTIRAQPSVAGATKFVEQLQEIVISPFKLLATEKTLALRSV
jgi:hypothetical protein